MQNNTLITQLQNGPLYQVKKGCWFSLDMSGTKPGSKSFYSNIKSLEEAGDVSIFEIDDPWFGKISKCILKDGSTPEPEDETNRIHQKVLCGMSDKMADAISALEGGPLFWDKSSGLNKWSGRSGDAHSAATLSALAARGIVKITQIKDGIKKATLCGENSAETRETDDQTEEIEDANLAKEAAEHEKQMEEDGAGEQMEDDGTEKMAFKEDTIEEMDSLSEADPIEEGSDEGTDGDIEEDTDDAETVQEEDMAEEDDDLTDWEEEPDKKDTPQTLGSGVTVLIDSENIGNLWLPLIDKAGERDRLIVFYTKNSPHLSYHTVYKLLNNENAKRLEWEYCYMGANALDFQLVTELGALLTEDKYEGREGRRYYIYSKDKGYNAVADYWERKGVRVYRVDIREVIESVLGGNTMVSPTGDNEQTGAKPATLCQIDTEQPEEAALPASFPEGIPAPMTKKELKKAHLQARHEKGLEYVDNLMAKKGWKEQFADALRDANVNAPEEAVSYVEEMSRSVSLENEEAYLGALSAQYGTCATMIMKVIKQNRDIRAQLCTGQYSSVKTRRKNYISLIFHANQFTDTDVRELSPLLARPAFVDWPMVQRILTKNHKGKKGGQKEAGALISTMNRHVRVLQMI